MSRPKHAPILSEIHETLISALPVLDTAGLALFESGKADISRRISDLSAKLSAILVRLESK